MIATTRALLAILAVVLYTGTAVGIPLVHATTEVVQAEQGVEAEHSDTCARIHADVSCPGVSGPQVPNSVVRHVPATDAKPHRPSVALADRVTPEPDREAAPPVRAPPAS